MNGSRSAPASAGHFTWRALAGAPVVAALLVVAAVIACGEAGVSFRDPDGNTLYVVEQP